MLIYCKKQVQADRRLNSFIWTVITRAVLSHVLNTRQIIPGDNRLVYVYYSPICAALHNQCVYTHTRAHTHTQK